MLAALDWLHPTVREAWQYGLGSLIPLLILTGERLWVMSRMEASPEPWDRLRVQLGELEFWPLWFFGWMYAARLPIPYWRPVVRVLFHTAIVVVLAFSAAELAFFDVTGGRGDLDTLTFGLQDLARVWPVVASELTASHY
ncbi:MAG: hypothetical protein FJ090_16905, partial [Deltaproteobacteria bacterium]|nr:hypothetical protein [Deltaproteobacteria bacterium]